MSDQIPAALREARIRLAAEYRQDEAMSPEQLCERAMAAALRWAWEDMEDWSQVRSAIAALERESEAT